MGAAMFVGGLRREKQVFNPTAASVQASMLSWPPARWSCRRSSSSSRAPACPSRAPSWSTTASTVEHLSLAVAVVLILTYVAGLLFSLRTHRDIFNPPYAEEEQTLGWSVRRSVGMLAIAGVAVGVMSEILVGSIAETSESIGLSEFFIGVIVVAIVGNAAEHWVAVLVAYKDKMDLAVNIAIGSSAQVALFVAPVLVMASFLIGPRRCRWSSTASSSARS